MTMNTKITVSLALHFTLLGCLAACGGSSPPTAPIGGGTNVQAKSQDEQLGSGPAKDDDPRFPAGRGVTLVVDQL